MSHSVEVSAPFYVPESTSDEKHNGDALCLAPGWYRELADGTLRGPFDTEAEAA